MNITQRPIGRPDMPDTNTTQRVGAPAGMNLDAPKPWNRGICVSTRQRDLCRRVGAPLAIGAISSDVGGLGFPCPNAPMCVQDVVCRETYARMERMRPTPRDELRGRIVGVFRNNGARLFQVYLADDGSLYLEAG